MFTTIIVALVAIYIVKKFFLKPTPKDVSGQVVLVTGGAGGIGLGMVKKFLGLGCKVVVLDINAEALSKVEKELNTDKVKTYVCDISNRDNIYATADRVKAEVGDVDILVNNAGIVIGKTFLDTSDTQTQKVMDINAMGPMWMTKAFLKPMVQKNKGHVVTIASAAGTCGVPKLVDYCASKHAAIGFTEALRMELAYIKSDVKTTCIMPFYINTGMFDGVKSWFIPMLEPEYVIESIVQAVLTNQVKVHLPVITMVVFLLQFVPISAYDFLSNLIGTTASMDDFKGRGTTMNSPRKNTVSAVFSTNSPKAEHVTTSIVTDDELRLSK